MPVETCSISLEEIFFWITVMPFVHTTTTHRDLYYAQV